MTKKRDCLLNPRSYTSSKAQYNGFQSILIAELSLAGVLGVLQHPRNLGVLFTLFQPEGADYAHHITASTPGLENLKTSLHSDPNFATLTITAFCSQPTPKIDAFQHDFDCGESILCTPTPLLTRIHFTQHSLTQFFKRFPFLTSQKFLPKPITFASLHLKNQNILIPGHFVCKSNHKV